MFHVINLSYYLYLKINQINFLIVRTSSELNKPYRAVGEGGYRKTWSYNGAEKMKFN